MWKKSFVSLAICLIGCSYQIFDISNRYFKYTTKTNVRVMIVGRLHTPAISMCFDLLQSLDPKKIKEHYGIDMIKNSRWNVEATARTIANMTAAMLFDMTYPNTSILSRDRACSIRKPNSLTLHKPYLSRDECYHDIDVVKYLNRFSMCYMLKPKKQQESLQYIDVSYSPSYPGVVLIYHLNQDMVMNMTLYAASVHSEASSDFYDSKLSTSNSIDFRMTPRITIVYATIAITRLPHPYDTGCGAVPNYLTVAEWILEKLNNMTMKELKHIHTLDHIYEPYEYPIITPMKLNDKIFHDKFMSMKTKCERTQHGNCEVSYNLAEVKQEAGVGVRLSLRWPTDSGVHVISIPGHETIDFIIYILSSIGVWFGLSIFSILASSEEASMKWYRIKRGDHSASAEEEEKKSTTYFVVHDRDQVLRTRVKNMSRRLVMMQHSLTKLSRNM